MNRRAVAGIVALNLLRIRRSRLYLLSIVVTPLLVVLVSGIVVGAGARDVPVGLVGGDSGPLARRAAKLIETNDALRVTGYDGVDQLDRGLRSDEVVAGVVIPDDYDEALQDGRSVDLPFLANLTRPMVAPARSAIAGALSKQGILLQAAGFATRERGTSFDVSLSTASRLAEQSAEVEGRRAPDTRTPGTFDYAVPGTLVFFMFATALGASGLLVDSRQRGLTRRWFATPVPARALLAGEAFSRGAITILQALVVVVGGVILFGVDWASPGVAMIVLAVFVLVCTGAAMLLGSIVRTFEQAIVIGSALGLLLAMLGGCLWPLEVTPPLLRPLAWLTPHAWAMSALIDLQIRGGSLQAVVPQISVLAAFAAVLLTAACWRFRRVATA